MSWPRVERVKCVCDHCRKEFLRYPSAAGRAKFCSRRCMQHHKEPLATAFLRGLCKPTKGGCLIWKGSKSPYGYGIILRERQGKRRGHFTHRFAYELANGPIPKGLNVCHKCDNPLCCNPQHLFLGTHSDNNRDMNQKGRNVRGEKQGHAKLTAKIVIAIRHRYEAGGVTLKSLGSEFGIHFSTISNIVRRKTWKHVD